MLRDLILLTMGGLVVSAPLGAQTLDASPGANREPADVFVHVAVVRAELELIRQEMGRPQDTRPEIGVLDAAPREVFFQALTLLRKADQLCFELTRERAPLPTPPRGPITPDHVYGVVDQALDRIRLVKVALRIIDTVRPPARDPDTRPTDVLRATVQANRQLNLLVERPIGSSDVFEQVTLAIGYGARLLAGFPGIRHIPPAPPLERRKQPADVYQRLVDCFELIRRIAMVSNVPMLELRVGDDDLQNVTPSDVYDIASLLVSELAYLASRAAPGAPPPEAYYPGRKFPSDVYQRVGILEGQLRTLTDRVTATPDWLRPSPQ